MARAMTRQQAEPQAPDTAAVAGELYAAVADDVEAFFDSVIDQGSGIVDQAYVDVELVDGEPVCRYRTEQNGRLYRHVPLDDHEWDAYLQDVYAPEVVAAYRDDGGVDDGRVDRRPVYPE